MNLEGRTIGNYQIRDEIGRGGMGRVYRAYQPSLHRYVAIKVLPPQLAFDTKLVERFMREARAAAGLSHPNIVTIYDVAQDDDYYYIVMEYLDGFTLQELVDREGALPPARALRIVEQLGAALDYAHQRGFVHRDVKPSNIFVGEGDRVTLTDFGIAKALADAEELTRTGAVLGTPQYMAPEQAEGSRVDHRTDLYALGVVLYQMLVGRVPFRSTTPHAVLHDVIYEAPLPPRRLNPAITPPVEAVIMKAIAKQPDWRFQRGAHLTRALREAIAGSRGPAQAPAPIPGPTYHDPLSAPPPTSPPTTSKLTWILGGIAAVLFLAIAGLLVAIAIGREDRTPSPAATFTQVVAVATDTPAATATLVGGDASPSPVPAASQTATTVPSDTAIPATGTPPPADTPSPTTAPPTDTPTLTTAPPTNTPTATPTPTCSLAVDPELAAAWARDRLGCPTAGASITWAAWEPFERGQMIWRQDIDAVNVLVQTASAPARGEWQTILDDWDGSEESIGIPPPPGLYEPQRGFGWVWRTFLDGPTGPLGWAKAEEKGFCARVQPFESGTLLHSSTVEFCEDQLFNWARDPSFAPLFLALYEDGTWREY